MGSPEDDIRNIYSTKILILQYHRVNVSQMALDAGFGLYLKSNKYYLGASVTHINQASIKYSEVGKLLIWQGIII